MQTCGKMPSPREAAPPGAVPVCWSILSGGNGLHTSGSKSRCKPPTSMAKCLTSSARANRGNSKGSATWSPHSFRDRHPGRKRERSSKSRSSQVPSSSRRATAEVQCRPRVRNPQTPFTATRSTRSRPSLVNRIPGFTAASMNQKINVATYQPVSGVTGVTSQVGSASASASGSASPSALPTSPAASPAATTSSPSASPPAATTAAPAPSPTAEGPVLCSNWELGLNVVQVGTDCDGDPKKTITVTVAPGKRAVKTGF